MITMLMTVFFKLGWSAFVVYLAAWVAHNTELVKQKYTVTVGAFSFVTFTACMLIAALLLVWS